MSDRSMICLRVAALVRPLMVAALIAAPVMPAAWGHEAAEGVRPSAPAAADEAPSLLVPSGCPVVTLPGASAPLAPLAPELAAAIRDRVHKRTNGGVVSSVCRTAAGLYEIVLDGEIVYVDERATYLFSGNIFDLRNQENLTARRKEDILRVDVKGLPYQNAIKTVRGNGSRTLVVFEDPNCPYCRRFEKEIATLTDTTIYTFLYPILSRDAKQDDDSYPKSKSIWCAPDRTVAWADLMLQGKHLAPAAESCKTPLDQILTLGQKLHITGTPTLLFLDGRRAPGMIPLDKVQQMMAQAAPGGTQPAAQPAVAPAAPEQK